MDPRGQRLSMITSLPSIQALVRGDRAIHQTFLLPLLVVVLAEDAA